jgi:hypothetical protein
MHPSKNQLQICSPNSINSSNHHNLVVLLDQACLENIPKLISYSREPMLIRDRATPTIIIFIIWNHNLRIKGCLNHLWDRNLKLMGRLILFLDEQHQLEDRKWFRNKFSRHQRQLTFKPIQEWLEVSLELLQHKTSGGKFNKTMLLFKHQPTRF